MFCSIKGIDRASSRLAMISGAGPIYGNVITVSIYSLRCLVCRTTLLFSLEQRVKRIIQIHVLYFIDLRQPGLVSDKICTNQPEQRQRYNRVNPQTFKALPGKYMY